MCLSPLAVQALPLVGVLSDSAIWKKFGAALLEILLKISTAKTVLRLKWPCVLSESAPDMNWTKAREGEVKTGPIYF